MTEVEWPDGSRWTLRHLRLDLNGTRAGTHDGLPAVEEALGVKAVPIGLGAEKEAYVAQLGAETCVAIGNGRNDAARLRRARLGVAALGPEASPVTRRRRPTSSWGTS